MTTGVDILTYLGKSDFGIMINDGLSATTDLKYRTGALISAYRL